MLCLDIADVETCVGPLPLLVTSVSTTRRLTCLLVVSRSRVSSYTASCSVKCVEESHSMSYASNKIINIEKTNQFKAVCTLSSVETIINT